MLLTKAFRRKFIIPDFDQFTQQINKMYESAHRQEGGCVSTRRTALISAHLDLLTCLYVFSLQVADYIPQLAKFSPELWGVSLCTIDGQRWGMIPFLNNCCTLGHGPAKPPPLLFFFLCRHSVGDTKIPFCLQSCVKPLEYAIAVNELGSELVHRFVGKEPSGFKFNKLSLNEEGEWKLNTLCLLDPKRSDTPLWRLFMRVLVCEEAPLLLFCSVSLMAVNSLELWRQVISVHQNGADQNVPSN